MKLEGIKSVIIEKRNAKLNQKAEKAEQQENQERKIINKKTIAIAGAALGAALIGAGIIHKVRTGKGAQEEIQQTAQAIGTKTKALTAKIETKTDAIKEEAARRTKQAQRAEDIQQGLLEAAESKLSHKSAKESAQVFMHEAEIQDEALRRIKQQETAEAIQQAYKGIQEQNLSHKSAKESAKVFKQAIKEGTIETEPQPSIFSKIKSAFTSKFPSKKAIDENAVKSESDSVVAEISKNVTEILEREKAAPAAITQEITTKPAGIISQEEARLEELLKKASESTKK